MCLFWKIPIDGLMVANCKLQKGSVSVELLFVYTDAISHSIFLSSVTVELLYVLTFSFVSVGIGGYVPGENITLSANVTNHSNWEMELIVKFVQVCPLFSFESNVSTPEKSHHECFNH